MLKSDLLKIIKNHKQLNCHPYSNENKNELIEHIKFIEKIINDHVKLYGDNDLQKYKKLTLKSLLRRYHKILCQPYSNKNKKYLKEYVDIISDYIKKIDNDDYITELSEKQSENAYERYLIWAQTIFSDVNYNNRILKKGDLECDQITKGKYKNDLFIACLNNNNPLSVILGKLLKKNILYISLFAKGDYAKKGVGANLILDLIEYARSKQNIDTVELMVVDPNDHIGLVNYYKNIGFSVEKEKNKDELYLSGNADTILENFKKPTEKIINEEIKNSAKESKAIGKGLVGGATKKELKQELKLLKKSKFGPTSKLSKKEIEKMIEDLKHVPESEIGHAIEDYIKKKTSGVESVKAEDQVKIQEFIKKALSNLESELKKIGKHKSDEYDKQFKEIYDELKGIVKGNKKEVNEIAHEITENKQKEKAHEDAIMDLEKELFDQGFSKEDLEKAIKDQELESEFKKIYGDEPNPHKWMDIEDYKKEYGKGIFSDIYNKAKEVGSSVVQRVKDILSGVRKRFSPSIRKFLEKHGNSKIISIKVGRQPVTPFIETAASWLSFGRWDINKKKQNYETMLHLFMIIKLEDGSCFKLEKNHVPEITQVCDAGNESMDVKSPNITLNEFLANAVQKHGENVFVYDAFKANCQLFTKWLLEESGILTQELQDYILQDAYSVIEGLPWFESLAKKLTDTANFLDVIVHGGKKKIKGGLIGTITDKNLLAPKNENLYTDDEKQFMELIKIKHDSVMIPIGSFTQKIQSKPSDIDINQIIIINNNSIDQFIIDLQNIIININVTPNVYFSDFKAGIDERFPDVKDKYILRWSPEEIITGYKILDGNIKMTLKEALQMKSIVKLDIIIFINDRFIEESTFYILVNVSGEEQHFINLPDNYFELFIGALKNDIYKYSQADTFKLLKSVKRMWSLARIKKDIEMLRKLSPMITSNLFLLSQINADLETMGLLADKVDNPPIKLLLKAINLIGKNLSTIADIDLDDNKIINILNNIKILLTDGYNNEEFEKLLSMLHDYLLDVINKETVEYMEQNNLLPIPDDYLPTLSLPVEDDFIQNPDDYLEDKI